MAGRAGKRAAVAIGAAVLMGAGGAVGAFAQETGGGATGEELLGVPSLELGGSMQTPENRAVERVISNVPGGAYSRDILSEALVQVEEMLREAQEVTLTGVSGLDGMLGETFDGPLGEERVNWHEEINNRISLLDSYVGYAERLQAAEERLSTVRDSQMDSRIANIERVLRVVEASEQASAFLGARSGAMLVEPGRVEVRARDGRQRFRILGRGTVSEVALELGGVQGFSIEDQDCEGIDLGVTGECRVTVVWRGVRVDVPDVAEVVVTGLDSEGARIYASSELVTGVDILEQGESGVTFDPVSVLVGQRDGEAAVAVRAGSGGLKDGIASVIGIEGVRVHASSCAGMELGDRESCMVILRWEGLERGEATGNLVVEGVDAAGRRMVGLAAIEYGGEMVEPEEEPLATVEGVELEPDVLTVETLDGAAVLLVRALGGVPSVSFEVVGGQGMFSVEPGSCGPGGLAAGDECAAKLAWSGLGSSAEAYGSVLVSAEVESGRRLAQSVAFEPGRLIVEKEEREQRLSFERAQAEAAAESEALELGDNVVGDPDVGMTGFGGDALRLEDEHLAILAEEAGEEEVVAAAVAAAEAAVEDVVRRLEENRRDLEAQVASLQDNRAEATGFVQEEFDERERKRLSSYEARLGDRLRLWALVGGVRGGSARGRLYSWPPERGLMDVTVSEGDLVEGRWQVERVDPVLGQVHFRDLGSGETVRVDTAGGRQSWWMRLDAAGRLVSEEGYEEMRMAGRIVR